MGLLHPGNSGEGRLLTHFHAGHGDGWATLTWRTRGETPREVMVLRSTEDHAERSAEPASDPRQTLVYQGIEQQGAFKDAGLAEQATYYYTVFARDDNGVWQEQLTTTVSAGSPAHWRGEGEDAPDAALGRWHALCREMKAVGRVVGDARRENPTRM